jgi:tetratricopeptide (TPR) repeat protein
MNKKRPTLRDLVRAFRGALYLVKGRYDQMRRRYDEALADLNRAIELNPEDASALACRGYTYWDMERYDEALADFNRALELDPENAWAIVSRGQTYRAMGRYDLALDDFGRAIELDATDASAIAGRGKPTGRWGVMTRP